jgi:LPS sulfotransferase NodH
MLCRALTDTGVAGRPEEYFLCGPSERFPQGPRFWEQGSFARGAGGRRREEYLERVFRVGTTPNGVFGAKVMWSHVPCLLEKLGELPRFRGLDRAAVLHALLPDLRVVHLVRRDRVRQAVSWSRATQDGVWVASAEERPRPVAEPVYDVDLIRSLEGRLAEAERGWPQLFDELGVVPLRISYEDLVDAPRYASVVRSVLAHLGLEGPDVAIRSPRTLRQADATNEEWTRRYHGDRAASPRRR